MPKNDDTVFWGTKERPDFLTEGMLVFLDELRESGETNMWGASTYLMDEFSDLTKKEAFRVCSYWMQTFVVRHALTGAK